jgi:hypothetical protein
VAKQGAEGGRAGKTGRAAGFLHSQTGCAERCLEDTGLVRKCLNPIWTTKTETASRLRQRIETVLDWAKVHGHRTGDNPAAWRGHLQAVMPAPQKITRVEDFAARLTGGDGKACPSHAGHLRGRLGRH